MRMTIAAVAALIGYASIGASWADAADDPFQVKSVWTNAEKGQTLTVTERVGESFRARFQIGEGIDRVVTGTIKDGKVSWLGKDVRAIKGGKGGDNHGTIAVDTIDFIWRDDQGGSGKYTLQLSK